jgi:hypothetical protein
MLWNKDIFAQLLESLKLSRSYYGAEKKNPDKGNRPYQTLGKFETFLKLS